MIQRLLEQNLSLFGDVSSSVGSGMLLVLSRGLLMLLLLLLLLLLLVPVVCGDFGPPGGHRRRRRSHALVGKAVHVGLEWTCDRLAGQAI